MSCFTRHTFDYLAKLKTNNNREWFNANKGDYEKSHAEALCFVENLMEAMAPYDMLVERSPKKKYLSYLSRHSVFERQNAV